MSDEKDDLTPKQRAIRKRAEEIIDTAKPEIEEVLTTPEVDKVMHELHVHQIELEMQNEELRQTQIALEQAKAHYMDLYDFAPVGYLTLNTDGIIKELNLTAVKLLGKQRSKIIQQRFVKFVPDGYKDVWYRHFQRAKELNEAQGCELPFGNKSGEISYYHLNCQCMDCEKSPILMRVTLTDVTERKRMEAKLRESEAVTSVLVNHAPGGMLILDDQMRIRSIKKHDPMIHTDLDPLVGRSFNDVLSRIWEEPIIHRFVDVFKNTLVSGEPYKSSDFTETRRDTGVRESYQLETQQVTLPNGKHGVACYYLNITEQKKLEEALRIAGVAFETQEAICITDQNNVIQSVNRSFTRLTGYSAEEVVGRNPDFLRSDLYDKAVYDVVRSLTKQFGFWEGELWGKRKNGETFPIWLIITGVKDAEGKVTHYVSAINDISERKQAEALQRDREDLDWLQLFVEHVPAAIAMFDKDMRYLAASQRWQADYGLTGKIVGLSHYEILLEIPERWKKLHRRALAGESLNGREDRFKRADGTIQWLNWSMVPWRNTAGEIGGIMLMSEEITERKRIEQLSIAAAAFETQDSIAIADANKNIQRVNKAFCRITGYSAEEATNLSFFNSKRHETEQFKEIWASIHRDGYWRGELWEKRKNGEPYLMAINITAVKSSHGDISHYVADFIDITENRRLEEKLKELNRDFSAFLEHTSDYVYYKDADNRFRFCSNSLASIVGKEQWQDMVGKDLFEMFPEDKAQAYYEAELPVVNEGKTLLNQLEPFFDENGAQGWVSTSKWPQFDQNGNFIGIFGISRDVTEQQKVERTLRWSEELNRKILEAFPARIAVIDSQGFIITVNEAWKKFARENCSCEPHELATGANYLDACRHSSLMNDKDAIRALAGIEAVLSGASDQFSMEYLCDSPQGKRWFLKLAVQLIQNDIVGAVIAHQNITERKEIEDQLKEAEQRWRFALQAANLGSWELNLSNSTTWSSNRHGQIFGYQEPLPVWSYEKFLQHILEEERTNVDQYIQGAIAAHQDYAFECPIRRVDGEICWISIHAKYSIERPELMFGLIEDITGRKNSEILLRESEARYRHLLENQTDIIIRHQPDGTILYVNEACCRFFGKSKAELEGQKWQPVVWPDDIPIVLEKLNTVSPSKPIVTIENRVIAAKGKVRWGQFVNRAFFDGNGNWVETQTVGRDITERKKYEESLRIAAAAFDAQESILVTDTRRIIQKVNKAFTRITGYSAEEAIGKTPGIVRSGLHDKAFYDNLLETVARDGYWHGEIWNKRKNGEIFPVLQTITRVLDENGQLSHYVGAMVDITAQKQAEKVLLDARKHLESQVATSQEELDRIKAQTVEINAALNVLLRQRETDKSDAKIALTDEVEATVLPLLKKLKAVSAGRLQTIRLIKLIEDNLDLLVKSYGRTGNLSATYQKLTPIETQVAAMIRQGQPTKIIAAGLNIAPGTVSIHRKHIRKKLGLDGKKDNLHSYLMSLTE